MDNFAKYFCLWNGNIYESAKIRDNFLKSEESDINNFGNKKICCKITLNSDPEIERVEVKIGEYQLDLENSNWDQTLFSNESITFNNIANGQANTLQVSKPRILPGENSKIFFEESIAYNATNKTITETDGTYTQYILVSNGSNHSIRKLLLKAEAPNSDVNISLIIFKEDNLTKNRIIVFFADSNDDPNIRYATAQQVGCNETNFKNASADSLDPKEIKNALDGTTLDIKCLTYNSSFQTTEQDICPKSPKNPHEITITHGDATQKVAVYNSTWKSSVCYKILGNF